MLNIKLLHEKPCNAKLLSGDGEIKRIVEQNEKILANRYNYLIIREK